MALIFAALLRGIGLSALFNWTPFYLRETLEMSTLQAGVYYALLTGMGIVSAPVLGVAVGQVGPESGARARVRGCRPAVAGGGQRGREPAVDTDNGRIGIVQFRAAPDNPGVGAGLRGEGTEATAIGLLFGINGVIGIGSPFLASAIIDYFGNYGAVFYYAGILTLITAFIVMVLPLRNPNNPSPPSGG